MVENKCKWIFKIEKKYYELLLYIVFSSRTFLVELITMNQLVKSYICVLPHISIHYNDQFENHNYHNKKCEIYFAIYILFNIASNVYYHCLFYSFLVSHEL